MPEVTTPVYTPIIKNNQEYYRLSIDTVGYYDSYELRLTAHIDGEPLSILEMPVEINSEDDNLYFVEDAFGDYLNLFFKANYLAKKLVQKLVDSDIMLHTLRNNETFFS